jgi:hypothetical protein
MKSRVTERRAAERMAVIGRDCHLSASCTQIHERCVGATAIVGSLDNPGDDDGPAGVARLRSPGGLVFDSSGTMYVTAHHAVRRIADGVVCICLNARQ